MDQPREGVVPDRGVRAEFGRGEPEKGSEQKRDVNSDLGES